MHRTLSHTFRVLHPAVIAGLALAVWQLPCKAPAEPADWSTVEIVDFSDMQAVNSDGSSAWSSMPVDPDINSSGHAFRLRGIVLNNPSDMLDSTAGDAAMGGQWQAFIQRLDGSTDTGGTALWMGQNIGRIKGGHPTYSYTDGEWNDEMLRINYPELDAALGGGLATDALRAGDVIEVRARGGLFYGGKYNVNEEHWKDELFDFDIVILSRDQTPDVTDLYLSDIKDTSDQFLFGTDLTDTSNPEHYQSTMVRLNDVSLVDDSGWGANGYVTVTDGSGRMLSMHLGLTDFDTIAPPTVGELFDVVGIFNQEDTNDYTDYTQAYKLWVMDAGQFIGSAATVPEPTTAAMLLGGALAWLSLRRRRRHANAR